jgi:hypothetical protein
MSLCHPKNPLCLAIAHLLWLTAHTTLSIFFFLCPIPERNTRLLPLAGNESANSDSYGLCVRMGFYLQGFAFTLQAFTSETRKGMLLTAATIQSHLASLSVLLYRTDISPAEALTVIQANCPSIGGFLGGYGGQELQALYEPD